MEGLHLYIPLFYSHPEISLPHADGSYVARKTDSVASDMHRNVPQLHSEVRVSDTVMTAFFSKVHTTELLPATIVPLHRWFGLEVGPVDESVDMVDLSLPYRQAGALGFLRRKGKSGDRRHLLRMVFKDEALRNVALASAEKLSEFSDVSAFSMSEEPQRIRSYRFFAFEAFWRHLYSRKRSVWVHERVMNGAPCCLRIPYAPDQKPAVLRELAARDEQNLLNRELFEADRYPPLANPCVVEESGALPLHKLSCTRDWLRDFCWDDASTIGLEALAMRRLELVLSTLCDIKSWSFSHPIYPAVDSPYIKAVRYICRGIQAAVERGDAACSWLTPAQRADGVRAQETIAHDRERGMASG